MTKQFCDRCEKEMPRGPNTLSSEYGGYKVEYSVLKRNYELKGQPFDDYADACPSCVAEIIKRGE